MLEQEQHEQPFMVAAEVADFLRCSKSTAYRIMGKINNELKAQGKIVIHGRVSRKSLMERVGGV